MTQPINAYQTETGRYYNIVGVDRPLISVTTVIGATENKPFLVRWAAKLALETGDVDASTKVRDAASERGTSFHDWAQQWGLGNEPAAPLGLEGECVGFLRLAEREGFVVEATEATVYDPDLGYAGTLDALLRMPDGRLLVCDHKTSKSLQKSVALQLTALRNAKMIALPDGTSVPVPKIDGACAIHVTAKGSKLVPVQSGEAQWKAFRAALTLAQYFGNEAKIVFREEDPSAS